jgi:hypothetical protein
MMQFNNDELELIISALETIQEARSAITTNAVIDGDYIRADAALKDQAQREQIINRINTHFNRM